MTNCVLGLIADRIDQLHLDAGVHQQRIAPPIMFFQAERVYEVWRLLKVFGQLRALECGVRDRKVQRHLKCFLSHPSYSVGRRRRQNAFYSPLKAKG